MDVGKNIAVEDARALVSDPALWPLVRDFLWDFAPQIHESWLDGIPGISGISGSPRIKHFILDSLGVAPCFHAFPKDDWSRLLLLDGATLESIAKWLGALALAGELRRVTDGKTVRGLKTALPGIYPEVFGFTEYFRKWKIESVKCKIGGEDAGCRLSLVDDVISAGLSILMSLLAPLPETLVARFRLKLPKSRADAMKSAGKSGETGKSGTALTKLLKLKFPEAYKLCC